MIYMAEAVKKRVGLRSIPVREIDKEMAFYMATINQNMSSTDIAAFLARFKPLSIVEDVTREKRHDLEKAINNRRISDCLMH
jgi:hypothetical protein